MSNFKIRSSNLSYWDIQENLVESPKLDYGFLESMFTKQASVPLAQKPIVDEEDKVEDCPYTVKDLRKNAEFSLDDLEDKKQVDKLEESSRIPVPGMMINEENSESDYAPPTSDWVAPNGPVWSSNT